MEGLVADLGLSNRVVNRSIERAIEWLEMDPLTLEGLQAAHDSLMDTATTCDVNDHLLFDLVQAHASSLHRTIQKDDDDLVLHNTNRVLQEWWTGRTDLYRALWVVSRLIVASTPIHQAGIHPIHDDAENDSTKVAVRKTLLETIHTCQYMLQHVLSTFGAKQNGQRHHHHNLPDSRHSLLAATMDVIQSDPDGTEYDAAMDPVDPIHSHAILEHDNIQNSENVSHMMVISGNEPNEKKNVNPHEEEEEDECYFPMNPEDWAAEEDELLDIALVPVQKREVVSQKKGTNHPNKRHNHPRFVWVAKEGWLVWARRNHHPNGTTAEERIRCLVRLYPVCGTISLRLEQRQIPPSNTANHGNVNEETVAFFEIISTKNNEDEESKTVVCEPVFFFGKTFHFQVLVRDRKGNHVTLILGVDEVTGGGLAEGCEWVTILTNTIAETKQRKEAWHNSIGTKKRVQLTRHDATSCMTDMDNDVHNPNTMNPLRASVVVNTATTTTTTTTMQELISAMDILE